jgi:hypothetical protein
MLIEDLLPQHLVFPMGFYVLYIWSLAVRNFRVRINAVKAGEMSAKYFKSFSYGAPTEKVQIYTRHFDNQFQLPMLFFVTCVTCISLQFINQAVFAFAWFFVVTRLLHSFVHLGSNKIISRVVVFSLGWLGLLGMWVNILIFVANTTS